jgi:hypothetical protein
VRRPQKDDLSHPQTHLSTESDRVVKAGDVLGGGTVMTRYYLEVRYRVTPANAVDEHTDTMMTPWMRSRT